MYIFFLPESKKQKENDNDNEENMLRDLRANRIKHRPIYNDDDPFDLETNADVDVYDFNEDDHASDASVSISNHDNYYKIQIKIAFKK